MAITQAMTTSFKVEILQATHQFGANTISTRGSLTAPSSDAFKLALYTSTATLDATTTAYSATNEVGNSGSYAAGGGALTISTTPTFGGSGTTSYLSFSDLSFTTATITARGALIYNSTQSNKSVAVLDFGSDKTSTAGTFTIQFPTANNTSAIIRIA